MCGAKRTDGTLNHFGAKTISENYKMGRGGFGGISHAIFMKEALTLNQEKIFQVLYQQGQ